MTLTRDQKTIFITWPLLSWLSLVFLQLLFLLVVQIFSGQIKYFLFSYELPAFFLAVLPSYLIFSLANVATLVIPWKVIRITVATILAFIGVFFYFANYVSLFCNRYFLSFDVWNSFLTNPYLHTKYFLHLMPAETFWFTVWLIATFIFTLILGRIVWAISPRILFSERKIIFLHVLSIIAFLVISMQWIPLIFAKIEPFAAQVQGYFRNKLSLPQVEPIEAWTVLRPPTVTVENYLAKRTKPQILKKNIIIILVESLRPDQLLSFGGKELVLENVEKLSKKSILFTDTYAQSSHSSYADPAVYSSQYPLRSSHIHFYEKRYNYPRSFLYDILKQLGYKTAIFSSQDEDWGRMYSYLNSDGLDQFAHAGNFVGDAKVPNGQEGLLRWLQGDKLAGKIDDRLTVDGALKWLDNVEDQPFFLGLNFQNSHIPYVLPEDYSGKRRIKKENIMNPMHPLVGSPLHLKQRYADSLGYVDEQLGRILKFLEQRKLLNNTIVVLIGDNGEAFQEHDEMAHGGVLYEEAVHVPMLFYIPGQQPRVDTRPAQHLDIAPSLLALLGLPTYPGFQGLSLFSSNQNLHRSRFLVSQSPLIHQLGIVKDSWKLLWTPHFNSTQLFNLKKDPQERTNLATVENKKAEYLSGLLKSWAISQLSYYNDEHRMTKEFPPYYLENER